MNTVVKNLYEGMFLIDSVLAGNDWDGVIDSIKAVLEKADAEIVSLRKWNDCRLAYEIDKKSRGTYILCYFRSDGSRIQQIERDVQLSERFMRVLILRGDHLTEADLEKETPASQIENTLKQQAARAAEAKEKEQAAAEKTGSVDSEPAEAVKGEQDAKGSDVEPQEDKATQQEPERVAEAEEKGQAAAEETGSVDSEPAEAVKDDQDAKGSDVEPQEDVEGEEGK